LAHTAAPDSTPLSLHDALPILSRRQHGAQPRRARGVVSGTLATALLAALPVAGVSATTVAHADSTETATSEAEAASAKAAASGRSEEHTSELQSRFDLVCRLLL